MERIYSINLDLIPAATLADWNTANKHYFTKTQLSKSKTCVHNKVFVDASLIKSADLSKWLQDNGNYICYIESNETIEKSHNVTNRFENEYENLSYVSISWQNLKNQIDIPSNQNYKQYIFIDVDSINNKLTFTFNKQHNVYQKNYSLPFILSVVDLHQIALSDNFGFGIDDDGKLVMRVKGIVYYDITEIPFSLELPFK